MKFLFIFLLFFSWTWQGQTAEPGKEVSLDEEFTIKFGQQVEVKDANLRITFTAVEEDSRCPVDVVCVWAGNARLNLEVKRSKKKFVSSAVNTTVGPREIVFKGYRVKLIAVKPERKVGIPVPPADYEATLVVSSK
jgi:uncharacterized Zn finger protein